MFASLGSIYFSHGFGCILGRRFYFLERLREKVRTPVESSRLEIMFFVVTRDHILRFGLCLCFFDLLQQNSCLKVLQHIYVRLIAQSNNKRSGCTILLFVN